MFENYIFNNNLADLNKKFRGHELAFLMGMFILSSMGYSRGINRNEQPELKGYPIDSDVFTTIQRVVIPEKVPSNSEKIFPCEVSKYQKNGYGRWHYGSGLNCIRRTDIMPSNYKSESVINTVQLLNFFTVTDIHITDKESPAQLIYFGYKGGICSAYSPVMLYTTHVLDAAIQTINFIHKKNQFDFGIFLGDAINNTQYNELRWYLDVIDGKNINPDSGIKDDAIPGPYNDYQDEYKAVGLDKSISWYQAIGNHDHFWMGSFPADHYIRTSLVGEDIIEMGHALTDPLGIKTRGIYMGSIDGRTPYGDVFGVGPMENFTVPPKVFAADTRRRSLSRREWMTEFFKTSSKPYGHGFTMTNIRNDFACYTFEPKSNIPIKVIVLDDTQNENNPNINGYAHGYLDKIRYNWLINELNRGQNEDKLMIIAAHVPICSEKEGSTIGWGCDSYISEKDLVSKLYEYSNLLMWIAGHRHCNTITAFKSPDPNCPELGFWQVETSSLRDFPQQFRIFQIVLNSDNTISIITTNVDPAVEGHSLAAQSRSYSIAAQQLFKNEVDYSPSGAYNAELIKQLNPKMQNKIKNYRGQLVTASFKCIN